MNPLHEAAAEIQASFAERSWSFCFIGGLAVQRWGEPRTTQDVDATLLTGFGNEEIYVDALLSGLPPTLHAEFDAIVRSIPLQVLRQRALAALRVDVREHLASLDMPVLYLEARHDRLIRPPAGREVLRLARQARHAVIDAPHFLFQMAPRAAAAGIRTFLGEIGARAPS